MKVAVRHALDVREAYVSAVGWYNTTKGFLWMDHHYGWMGGGMWLWTAIGILIVVLLVVAIDKLPKR